MSKELETIDAFIEGQQSQINELVQTIMMLQIKVKMLESENKTLKDINSKKLDKYGNIIVRKGLRERIKDNPKLANSERGDAVPPKTVIHGFTTSKGAPAE